MTPTEYDEIAAGDRVLIGNRLFNPRTGEPTGGTRFEWRNVVEVDVVPPKGWGVEGLRIEVDGGCGGGTWLPDPESVLLAYTPPWGLS